MKLDRIISFTTLAVAVIALVLVLKRPQPIAPPQSPVATAANARAFQEKLGQLVQSSEQPKPSAGEAGTPAAVAAPAEVHLTSGEVTAAIAEAAGVLPSAATTIGGTETPNIKDYNVNFDGDLVHGQFLTEVAGKQVWVTVSGHIGAKDGYATFEPTEFKVGDLNVPVALVNGPLQKKLAEQHDRLKLPDYIGGIKVENGELVVSNK
jgi:hypothetical protein